MALTNEQKLETFRLIKNGEKTASDIARLFNVHRTTISRLLLKNGSLTEQLDKITGHF